MEVPQSVLPQISNKQIGSVHAVKAHITELDRGFYWIIPKEQTATFKQATSWLIQLHQAIWLDDRVTETS